MPHRALYDLGSIVGQYRIGQDEDRVGALLPQGSEQGIVVIGLLGVDRVDRQPGPHGRALHGLELLGGGRIGSVAEHPDSLDCRERLLEDVEPLGAQLRRQHGDPGHVAARAAETRHEPGLHGIDAAERHDDRDRPGRVSRRADGARSHRDDHVDIRPNQLGGQAREPAEVALRESILERDVLPRQVAQLAHRLPEVRVPSAAWARRLEPSDTPELARRLRTGCARCGEETTADRREERPSVHREMAT